MFVFAVFLIWHVVTSSIMLGIFAWDWITSSISSFFFFSTRRFELHIESYCILTNCSINTLLQKHLSLRQERDHSFSHSSFSFNNWYLMVLKRRTTELLINWLSTFLLIVRCRRQLARLMLRVSIILALVIKLIVHNYNNLKFVFLFWQENKTKRRKNAMRWITYVCCLSGEFFLFRTALLAFPFFVRSMLYACTLTPLVQSLSMSSPFQ